MELTGKTIDDAQCGPEGGSSPPRTGLIPDALPEVQPPVQAADSPAGVSTKCTLSASAFSKARPRWYVLRATYGRAEQSFEYLSAHGIEAFHPTIRVVRMVNGKRRKVKESRLPNILFARSTEQILKTYVYDNVNLPHLRFYHRYVGLGQCVRREPLIVPDRQMESLKIICSHKDADNVYVPQDERKFDSGETVIITDGDFKGVIGKVARYCGQLRVAVIIEGLLTIATAYVPRGYLRPYTQSDDF